MIQILFLRRAALVALLAAAIGGLAGCQLFSGRPQHILLITVDSLRPDRLGTVADGKPLTPNLDALAATSTRFPRASSHAVLTAPAAASLLTGTLPPVHGLRGETGFRLRPGVMTLAQRLTRHGYRCGAVLGTSQLDPLDGLNHDFWTFLRPPLISAPQQDRPGLEYRAIAGEVNLAAMNWLRTNVQYPTFLWIHFRDLHYPYRKPTPTGELIGVEYDAALGYLDGEVGALVEAYRRLRILDDTLLILTATHGESLGEQGEQTHSNFLHSSTLRVPLLILAGEGTGGNLPPAEVDGLVGLIDVVPTVLDLIGSRPDATLPGRSLAPLARGESPDRNNAVYAEAMAPLLRFGWSPARSLETENWKLILDGVQPALFRIADDREERSDRSGQEDEQLEELTRRLEALSHPEGGADEIWKSGTRLPLKQRIELLEELTRATLGLREESLEGAETTLNGVIRRDPGNLHAARLLATIFRRRRDAAGGEQALRSAVDRHSGLAEAHVVMGDFYGRLQRPLEAVTEYLTGFEIDPDRSPLLVLAAQAETLAGRQEEAIYWMERILEREGDSAFLHALAAEYFWEFLDYEKALLHLQTAWDLNMRELPDPLRLGECLQHLARYEEALDAFQAVEKSFPGRVAVQTVAEKIGDTYLLLEQEEKALEEYARVLPAGDPLRREIALSNLLSSKGRPDLALRVLDRLERQIPDQPEVAYVRGEIHLTEKALEAAEADFGRVLELEPENRPARYNLARVAILRGDEAAALDRLRSAMEGDDGSLLRLLKTDPYFWQTGEGSPLALYLQDLIGADPGQ
jgi:arylsulfatase